MHHLSPMKDEDLVKFNIPNASPFVYEFDTNFKPLRHYYLEADESSAPSQSTRETQDEVEK